MRNSVAAPSFSRKYKLLIKDLQIRANTEPEGVEKRSLFGVYVENFSDLCSLLFEQI